MFKNIDLDDISHGLGYAFMTVITIWMIVTYIRIERRCNKKYGKGWRKKMWDRYHDDL